MSERKIISIGYEIPGYSEMSYGYASSQSLLDADIIIFESDLDSYSGYETTTYNGKTCYSVDQSFRLKQATDHWKRELSQALETGKTVFVFFKKYKDCFIHTGEKQFSGTGRNTRTTNIVATYNNYMFFPISLPQLVPKEGSTAVFKGSELFSVLNKEFKQFIKYESYLDEKMGEPIYVSKTGEKILGTHIRVKAGNLILLPVLDYDYDKFVKYDEKKKEETWKPEATKFGSKLIKTIVDIDRELQRQGIQTPPPEWSDNEIFELPSTKKIRVDIQKKQKEIENITQLIVKLQNSLDKELLLKGLLYEKGKPLENAISMGLKILGYSSENFNDGNLEIDHIIISPEGDRFIGEAEGKDSSAVSIDKFRQLTGNIQEDLHREEVSLPAIGILFGNGFRLTNPQERAEQFTTKCLTAASSSNCTLVKTSDLFTIAKYISESNNDQFAFECRVAIKDGIGRIVNFPLIPIQQSENVETLRT